MSIEMPHYKSGAGPEYCGNGQNRLPALLPHPPEKPEIRSVTRRKFTQRKFTGGLELDFKFNEGKTPARRLNAIYHGTRVESSKIFSGPFA